MIVIEKTNEKYASATRQNGIGTERVMDWVMRDVSEELKLWGHAGGTGGKIIFKCDGESGMVALRDAVAKFHGGVVIPETSAKGASQSNGAAESAGKLVREFTRIFKTQLQEKARVERDGADPILHWAVRWAAMVCSNIFSGRR